ncbi:uncharacterized protein DUF2752 [Balneicella halophila]|uniref:Uncharacterized protein DUF2752 n=1 Tax=Balneicella halophila TaxID=1537566 RepID=A0A7L4UQI3_BALHA|nr:DUF2752 domain-containing protein [Balneicella halophila]PVX52010.1 uncharacterized protein DUF2752 [Balneicella halophila]
MLTSAINIKKRLTLKRLWRHRELFFWILALVMLYRADLHTDFTLCIPSHLGFENCPGCGLGHSITAAMHGDFELSWSYHYLGIVALGILLFHILKLFRNLITELKNTENYGQ